MPLALLLAFALQTPLQDDPQMRAYSMRAANATAVFHAEEERQKAGICTQSLTNRVVENCAHKEVAFTEASYVEYVRSLGAMVRGVNAPSPPRPIGLDSAELAWQDYREKTCDAYVKSDTGKNPESLYDGCRVNLTWSHMHELKALYSYLF